MRNLTRGSIPAFRHPRTGSEDPGLKELRILRDEYNFGMKTCPFCSESIQDSAVKCRYCGEFFVTPHEDRKIKEEQGQKVHTAKNSKVSDDMRRTKEERKAEQRKIHELILIAKSPEKHTSSEIEEAERILLEKGIDKSEIQRANVKNLELMIGKSNKSHEQLQKDEKTIKGWGLFYMIGFAIGFLIYGSLGIPFLMEGNYLGLIPAAIMCFMFLLSLQLFQGKKQWVGIFSAIYVVLAVPGIVSGGSIGVIIGLVGVYKCWKAS